MSEMIDDLPTRVMLDCLAVPAIVLDRRGVVVFANHAFASMLGRERHDIGDVVYNLPEQSWTAIVEGKTTLELKHAEGYVIHARAGGSVFLRREDPLQLITFHDVTELIWHTGQRRSHHA